MAEDERMNDEAADAGLGSRSGARTDGETNMEGDAGGASGAELSGGGDPASVGEGADSQGVGDEGRGREGGGRTGDWDPGQVSGGGELY
jgi:hypothetical protein